MPSPRLISSFLCLAALIASGLPLARAGHGPAPKTRIFTQDITNFWQAFDSVQATPDTARQRQLVQRLYLNRATSGLQAFAKSQEYRARTYVQALRRYPRFWASVRPATLAVRQQQPAIDQLLRRFQQLYRGYKPVEVFFTIGALNSGGTVQGQRVLIGTEIASATPTTEAAELGPWLQHVFKAHQNGVVELVAHEVVHTQQPDGDAELDGKTDLLGYCLQEGAAAFVAELLLPTPYTTPYLAYGRQHERALWQEFAPVLSSQATSQWLYNGNQAGSRPADLGYFMGYAICRAYYQQAGDKQQALADIIKLRHDKTAPHEFLARSGYAARWR